MESGLATKKEKLKLNMDKFLDKELNNSSRQNEDLYALGMNLCYMMLNKLPTKEDIANKNLAFP